MTTKLTDEQRNALEACAGHVVRVADEETNRVYYLVNEEDYLHLQGLQSEHEGQCQTRLRELIEEGIRSPELPADEVFESLRAAAQQLSSRNT